MAIERSKLKGESSKERLLKAINMEEPDHVPLLLRFFERQHLIDKAEKWSDQFSRVDKLLSVGLDDVVSITAPLKYSQEVRSRHWKEIDPRERYTLIVKEYETPKGKLRQIARQTPDRPWGNEINIFDDYNVPRARTKKYLVESASDLDALSCLFDECSREERLDFLTYSRKVIDFARSCGILVEGDGPMLGDAAIWLCGVEKVVLSEIKDPAFLHRLLDIIHGWDMARVRLLLEAGVDIVFHRGWYESAMFWSPKAYRTYLAPRIKEEADEVHRAGSKFGYIATRDTMPLLKIYEEVGVDLLFGPDPVEGNCDLQKVKKEVGEQICLWGGINSSVTLEMGSKEQIEDSVAEAFRTLAPGGGFILGLVDAVFGETPGTVETPASSLAFVIECWRKLRESSKRL
ncbi:MAG: uroporphyrinogen decarboxylase family protein [Thermoproteota archaeon]